MTRLVALVALVFVPLVAMPPAYGATAVTCVSTSADSCTVTISLTSN